MRDQAEQLRQIVYKMQKVNQRKEDKDKGCARIITITSGKGGVGKTCFATNLGISLSQRGYRVVIIDGDIGLANVDLVLGMTSRYGLNEVILGQMDLNEVMVEGPGGIKFISGGSGLKELINLDSNKLDIFLHRISALNQSADIILIDTGAGATDNVIRMILAAHEAILIATPEPTAITDAYALTKIISSTGQDVALRLVVNKVGDSEEGEDVANKFTKAAERFLGLNIKKLGFIYDDPNVVKSVKEQVPYIIKYPKSKASRKIEELASALLDENSVPEVNTNGMTSFIKRFLGLVSFKNRNGYEPSNTDEVG